jgi:hypothetical protein
VNVAHEFRRGDALVFPSHKYHCVQPVKAGMRQVMILEFWVGEERDCNHRCERHFGECKLTWMEELAAAQVSMSMCSPAACQCQCRRQRMPLSEADGQRILDVDMQADVIVLLYMWIGRMSQRRMLD